MKFFVNTGVAVTDDMICAVAESFPSAEAVCSLSGESKASGSCTVVSSEVLDSHQSLSRTEYAVVLYTDVAYTHSKRHGELTLEYGEKYRALRAPVSLAELSGLFESIVTEHPEEESSREVVYDRGALRLTCGDRAESLTKLEARLYELFLRCGDAPLSREKIKFELWGENCRSNAPDVYVSYLRRKLGRLTGEESITVVRGVGYRLKRR